MKYTEFGCFPLRSDQRPIVEGVLDAYARGKKAAIVIAPTGSGKSVLAQTITTAFNSAYILTPTKILQDQYFKDFGGLTGQAMLKGKATYNCAVMEEEGENGVSVQNMWCQNGTSSARKQTKLCKDANKCHYYNALKAATQSPVTLMNFMGYLVWMMVSERMDEPYFLKRDLHVVDEAHNIDSVVRDFLGFEMKWERLKKMFFWVDGSLFKRIPNDNEADVLSFLQDLNRINTEHLNSLQMRAGATNRDELILMCEESEETNKAVRSHFSMEQKLSRLFTIIEDVNANGYGVGVLRNDKTEEGDDGVKIIAKPLYVGGYVKRQVHGERHSLFLSATLPGAETWANEVGLKSGEFEVFEMQSTFPAEHRKVFCMPVGRINQRTKDDLLKPVCDKIHEILSDGPNNKGIIHTPSYDWSYKIRDELAGDMLISKRLLVATRKNFKTADVLALHAKSESPTVIMSPAMREGVDLKDELSRIQIVVKAPFANLQDPCVRKKTELNNKWYHMNALMSFMQQVGRSIRGPEDWAHTYVLDQALVKLLKRYWNDLPKYFTDAIIFCDASEIGKK